MLRFIDGFDHETGSTPYNSKWYSFVAGGGIAITAAAARTGPGGVRFTSNGGTSGSSIYVLPANAFSQQTIVFGLAFRVSALPTGTNKAIIARGIANNASPGSFSANVSLYVDANGKLGLLSGSTVIDSGFTGTAINANEWHYVELKVKATSSTATGDAVIYLDGNAVNGVQAGKNTASFASTFGTVGVGLPGTSTFTLGSGATLDIDDFYLLDTSGSVNNAPLGVCKVETLFPDGAGASSQWTPNGAGANYTKVNDNPPDTDTTYVSTTGGGNRDSYAMGDLATVPAAVFGVQVTGYARVDAGETTRTAGVSARSGGSYSDGAASGNLTATYSPVRSIFETDASGAAWTGSTVNGMEAGVKLVS